MNNPLFKFLSSLRLTVACLVAALVLVFAGTLAQVHLGLWDAQKQYFHSLFVFWSPKGASWKIPVWPGGYLLGWVLMVNLIAAHITRFEFSKKKIGIFLTHIGLIMLLLGQFVTENFQIESNMRLEEGGAALSYSESSRHSEIALIDVTNPNLEEVVSIPDRIASQKGEVSHPKLPFKLRVKEWYVNSTPRLVAPVAEPNALKGTHGIGTRLTFASSPKTTKMDDADIPAAQIEVVGEKGVESTWMVSSWLSIPRAAASIQQQFASALTESVTAPQQFTHAGRTFQIALRPTRYYKPYSIGLIDFKHDVYQGTGIPKNFSSLVRLRSPATGPAVEDREVLIKMNQPLRHRGETYYQSSFEPGDAVSILQVVSNPAWLTPYVSCTIVALGLVIQFLMHLFGFTRKSKTGSKSGSPMAKAPANRTGKENAPRSHDSEAAAVTARAMERKTV